MTKSRTKTNTASTTIPVTTASNDKSNDPIALAMNNYLRLASKNRRPSSMVPRTAALYSKNNKKGGSNYLPTVKPPYTTVSLDRFEDTFRSDKLIQNAIVKRTELVIGRHGKIVLDTTEEFDSQDDRNAAMEKINANEQYQNARKEIQKLLIHPKIDFHNKLKAAVIQAKVYGRAAIEIIGNLNTGMPEGLHVLNTKRIGNVEIDPITWEFLGCHYLDLEKGPSGMDDVLSADQLIYFTNRDFHVSPGSLYYGLSELEGVIDGSDSKRIAKQEDIKEIMKSNWAPFLILRFLNPAVSLQQMQEIVNGLQPGLPFAHKQDMTTEVNDITGDLKKLTDCVDFLNRESIRELGVPAFIAGYEQITNYANSQQVLLAYKEIELEADRTWIKDTLQPQWLNKLFYRILGIEDYEENIPEVKLSYEFEDVSFETTLDKTNASLLLFDRGLISGEKVLKIADFEDEIEEYKLRKEEQDRQKQEMFDQDLLMKKNHNAEADSEEGDDDGQQQDKPTKDKEKQKIPASKQVSTTMKKRQAALYTKFEETLDAIAKNE